MTTLNNLKKGHIQRRFSQPPEKGSSVPVYSLRMLCTKVNWIFPCCTLQTTQLDIESSEDESVRRDKSSDDKSDTSLDDFEVTKKTIQTGDSADDDMEETFDVFSKKSTQKNSFKEALLRKKKKGNVL